MLVEDKGFIGSLRDQLARRPQAARDGIEPSKTFIRETPEKSTSCKFSHDGRYLAYLSLSLIQFYDSKRILTTDSSKRADPGQKPQSVKPPEGSKWKGFDVSSRYMLSYTDWHSYEVRID
jgi:hypothetical protein